jgi:hypothetical protein
MQLLKAVDRPNNEAVVKHVIKQLRLRPTERLHALVGEPVRSWDVTRGLPVSS